MGDSSENLREICEDIELVSAKWEALKLKLILLLDPIETVVVERGSQWVTVVLPVKYVKEIKNLVLDIEKM